MAYKKLAFLDKAQKKKLENKESEDALVSNLSNESNIKDSKLTVSDSLHEEQSDKQQEQTKKESKPNYINLDEIDLFANSTSTLYDTSKVNSIHKQSTPAEESEIITPKKHINLSRVKNTDIINQEEVSPSNATNIYVKNQPNKTQKLDNKIVTSGNNEDLNKDEDTKVKPKNSYKEKVDTVFNSLVHLFIPFKEVLVKTVPFTIYIIKPIEILGKFLILIAKSIALGVPYLLKVIKGRIFKILLALFVILFIGGAIISRAMNNPKFINKLELAIYKNTGYKASISGVIKLHLITTPSIEIKKINLLSLRQDNSNSLDISDLSASSIIVQFKFIPLLLGVLEVSNVEINDLEANINGSINTKSQDRYQDSINKIEQIIKTRLSSKIIKQGQDSLDLSDETEEDKINRLISEAKKLTSVNPSNVGQNKGAEKGFAKENKVLAGKPYITQDNLYNDQMNANLASDLNSNKGTVLSIFNAIFSKVRFDVTKISSLKFYKSTINIKNSAKKNIVSFTNAKGVLVSDIWGNLSMDGNFRLLNQDFNFTTSISPNNNIFNIKAKVSLEGNHNSQILIQAVVKDGTTSGKIDMDSSSAHFFISHYVVPLKDTYIKQFSTDFIFNKQILQLSNINLTSGDNHYKGKFIWRYNNIKTDAELDLIMVMPSLTGLAENVSYLFNNSQVKNNYFLSFVDLVKFWKKQVMDNLYVNTFKVSLNIENSIWNQNKIDKINTDFFVTENNELFINNFNLQTSNNKLILVGKILLNKNTGNFSLETRGKQIDMFKVLNVPITTKTLFQSIAKNDNSYFFKTKLVFNNTYAILNELQGNLGKRNINDSYVMINQNTIGSDITIDIPIDKLDYFEIQNIYNKQTEFAKTNDDINNNLFSIPDNLSINLNLHSDIFTYKGVTFQNANIDINFTPKGFVLKQLSAQGKYGGSILASFHADTSLSPKIIGNLNFTDYFVKLEDLNNIMFSKNMLVGNVILNGTLKFSGDNYDNPIKSLDGNLNFIKQERLKLARFAVEDGLYITISEKAVNKANKFFVNDLYGNVLIKDNKISFYPVFLSYIKDNKVYRGAFNGIYNFTNNQLDLAGGADNEKDTTKKISFSLSGPLFNPISKIKYYVDKTVAFSVKPKDKDAELVKKYKVNNKVIENLNKIDSKEYFNNNYNMEEKGKKAKEVRDKDYKKQVSRADKNKEYKFTPNEKSDLYPHYDKDRLYKHSLEQNDNDDNAKFEYNVKPKFMENR